MQGQSETGNLSLLLCIPIRARQRTSRPSLLLRSSAAVLPLLWDGRQTMDGLQAEGDQLGQRVHFFSGRRGMQLIRRSPSIFAELSTSPSAHPAQARSLTHHPTIYRRLPQSSSRAVPSPSRNSHAFPPFHPRPYTPRSSSSPSTLSSFTRNPKSMVAWSSCTR